MCGPEQENGVCRRKYNFKLEKEFDSLCIIYVVNTNRLRYAGHMIRRLEDLPQKAILKPRPQGMRRQGRLRAKSYRKADISFINIYKNIINTFYKNLFWIIIY
jgi:hypothetical protein